MKLLQNLLLNGAIFLFPILLCAQNANEFGMVKGLLVDQDEQQ